MSLHDDIMNILVDTSRMNTTSGALAYKLGHRDARHAAAELAIAAAERPVPGWIGCARIRDMRDVDECLRGFAADPTADNATMLVRDVLTAYLKGRQ